MKKIFSIFLILALAISVLSGCDNKTSSNEEKLKKPEYVLVKATSEGDLLNGSEIELYSGEFWSGKNSGKWEYVYTYDENGNKLTECNTNMNTNKNNNTEWIYDSDGNILTQTNYNNGVKLKEVSYSYHDNGKIKSMITDFPNANGANIKNVVNNYDSNGNITLERNTFADGTYGQHTHKYTYDEQGNKTNHESIYEGDHTIYETCQETWEYNSSGDVSKWSKIDTSTCKEPVYSETKKEMCVTYTYDDNGNLIEEENNEGGNVSTLTHKRNSQGEIIETITKRFGFDTSIDVYERNSDGYLLKETRKWVVDNSEIFDCEILYERDKSGILLKKTKIQKNSTEPEYVITYKYDENGNLIQYSSNSIGKVYIATFEYEKL